MLIVRRTSLSLKQCFTKQEGADSFLMAVEKEWEGISFGEPKRKRPVEKQEEALSAHCKHGQAEPQTVFYEAGRGQIVFALP